MTPPSILSSVQLGRSLWLTMEFIHDVFAYGSSVFFNWAGCLGLAFFVIDLIQDWRDKKFLTGRAYRAVVIVLLTVATFTAWRTERVDVRKKDKEIGDLGARIRAKPAVHMVGHNPVIRPGQGLVRDLPRPQQAWG